MNFFDELARINRAHCEAMGYRPTITYTRQPDGSFAYIPPSAPAVDPLLAKAEAEVTVEMSRAVGQVVHTLIGPEASVRLVAQRIFDDYPPEGYGTRAVVFPDRTVIVRARSCD